LTIKDSYQYFLQKIVTVQSEGEAKAIARIVFEDVFRVFDFNASKEFPKKNQEQLDGIITRLLQNEPIQYILGEADFYGYKFSVNNSVLIPRQETEELVFWIKNTVEEHFGKDVITLLDIGTGSGCIPISIKKIASNISVNALDVDEGALAVASQNAKKLDADINFSQTNILNQEEWGSFDSFEIIVSNPPYIPFREADLMPQNVKRFEPHLALFVEDNDPLIFYKKIIEFANLKLKSGGFLFFELNEFNAEEVLSLFHNNTFANVELKKDLNDKYRMLRAQKK